MIIEKIRQTSRGQEKQDPNKFERDVIKTDIGELKITFIGHGTLMLECGGKAIHIDPRSELADYSRMPRADAIFRPSSIESLMAL